MTRVRSGRRETIRGPPRSIIVSPNRRKSRPSCYCQLQRSKFRFQKPNVYKLSRSSVFSDQRIRSRDGYVLPFHRIVLLNLGPKFTGVFLGARVPKLELIDLEWDKDVLEEVLRFAALGDCQITEQNLPELIRFGQDFEVQGLLRLICDFLASNISHENVIELYLMTQFYFFCPEIVKGIRRFILRGFLEVSRNAQGFSQLSIPELKDLIQDNFLNVSEEQLFSTVETWILQDPSKASLLEQVRFTLMDKTFFDERVQPSAIGTHKQAEKAISLARSYFYRLTRARARSYGFIGSKFHEQPRVPSDVILAVGGWSAVPNGPTPLIETFDVRMKRWVKPSLALPEPRAYHGLVVMGSYLYIFGGYNGGDYLNDLVVYDLILDTWTPKTGMHEARCYISYANLDGCIYALGGYNGSRRMREVERYDTQSERWTVIRAMRMTRSDACAVALNGQIYAIGGFTGHSVLSSCEVYHPEDDEWTLGPSLNVPRSGVSAVVLGERIYVVGGFNGEHRLTSVECLDLTKRPHLWEFVASMHTPRSNASLSVIDEKLFVVGGFDGFSVIKDTEMYDPGQNTWTRCSKMNAKRSALSICTVSKLSTASFFLNRQKEDQ